MITHIKFIYLYLIFFWFALSIFFNFQASGLSIDESSFTGEIEPVSKTVDAQQVSNSNNLSERRNIAFMGTLVRCGKGKVSYGRSFLS